MTLVNFGWFWLGTVVGVFAGAAAVIVMSSNNRVRERESDEHH